MATKSNAGGMAQALALGEQSRGKLGGIKPNTLAIDESAEWDDFTDGTGLQSAEQRIIAFGKAVIDAGEAFAEIKAKGWHRRFGLTWEEYCPARWGLSDAHANRMIAAAPVLKASAGLGLMDEGPARELVSLHKVRGPEGVRELLSGFQDAGERPTQAALHRVVRALPKQIPDAVDLREHARTALAEPKVIEGAVIARADRGEADDGSSGQYALFREVLREYAAENEVSVREGFDLLLTLLNERQPDGQRSTAFNLWSARAL